MLKIKTLRCPVYSRKIVGWEIYATEFAGQAASVFHKAHRSPMKGETILATLRRLRVLPSFSRPAVSDDNPYPESMFSTLKGHHSFPDQPFAYLEQARGWEHGFER